MEVAVKEVLERKDGIKMVIIPKKSKMKKGDLVFISDDLTLVNKYKQEGK